VKKYTPKTELLYYKSKPIDKLSIKDSINLFVDEQKKSAEAVKKSSNAIEEAIKKIYDHLTLYKKGRLIYAGAGTSGRIAVQDAVELFPTFNWPKNKVDFILAGGKKAIFEAVENAEDNVNVATKIVNLKRIDHHDVVIGLAASGNTPFTCRVMKEAQNKKALTISISNNPYGKILDFGNIKIILNTKEEIIAGSTRLKAGTAQKMCLNMISSMVMVKMGKVKDGYMVEMVPTNQKLRERKTLINSNFVDN